MTADVTITTASRDGRPDRPARGPQRRRPATTRSASSAPTARPRPGRSRSGSSPAPSPRSRAGLTEGEAVVTGTASDRPGTTTSERRLRRAAWRSAARSRGGGGRIRRPGGTDRWPSRSSASIASAGSTRWAGWRSPRSTTCRLEVRPRRVRRDRRAVRLRQDHDDEHPRLPRPADRRRATASPGRRSPSSTTTAWRGCAAGRSASSSSPTTCCRARRALDNVATPLLYQGVSRRERVGPGDGGPRAARPRRPARPRADRAVRRPAAARRRRPGPRHRTRPDPRRRADRQPRQPLRAPRSWRSSASSTPRAGRSSSSPTTRTWRERGDPPDPPARRDGCAA